MMDRTYSEPIREGERRVLRVEDERYGLNQEVVPEVDRDRAGERVIVVPVGEAEIAAHDGDERHAVGQVIDPLIAGQEERVGGVEEAEDERAAHPGGELAVGAGEAGLDGAAEGD